MYWLGKSFLKVHNFQCGCNAFQCLVSLRLSAINLIEAPLYVMGCFALDTSKVLSLNIQPTFPSLTKLDVVQDRRPSMGKFGPEIDAPIDSSLVYSFTEGREEKLRGINMSSGRLDWLCWPLLWQEKARYSPLKEESRWWRQARWDRNTVSLACPALVIL